LATDSGGGVNPAFSLFYSIIYFSPKLLQGDRRSYKTHSHDSSRNNLKMSSAFIDQSWKKTTIHGRQKLALILTPSFDELKSVVHVDLLVAAMACPA